MTPRNPATGLSLQIQDFGLLRIAASFHGHAGSARLFPLLDADGLGMIEADVDEFSAGSTLSFFPFQACMGL